MRRILLLLVVGVAVMWATVVTVSHIKINWFGTVAEPTTVAGVIPVREVYSKGPGQSAWVRAHVKEVEGWVKQDAPAHTDRTEAFRIRPLGWGIGAYYGQGFEWVAFTNDEATMEMETSIKLPDDMFPSMGGRDWVDKFCVDFHKCDTKRGLDFYIKQLPSSLGLRVEEYLE